MAYPPVDPKLIAALRAYQEKRKPIVVNNPNDPRLKAYQDSLDDYKFNNPGYRLKRLNELGGDYKKEQVERNWEVPLYKEPEQPVVFQKPFVKPTYQQFLKTANQDYIGPDYNLEEAYKELPLKTMQAWAKDPERNHLPDTYKLPNHPTFSTESKYYRQGMKAGRWDGDKFIPIQAVVPLPAKMVPTNIAPVIQQGQPTPIPVPIATPPRGGDSIWGPGQRYSLKDPKVRQMLRAIQNLKK